MKDQINPATRAAYNAPFQVDSSYLNARDGCLKALLRNEKIGYVKTEEPTVMFAPDMLLMPLSENNAALEQQHLFVLEGILKTVRSDCPVTVEPNMYPIDRIGFTMMRIAAGCSPFRTGMYRFRR